MTEAGFGWQRGGGIDTNQLLDFSTIREQDVVIFASIFVLALLVMFATRRLLHVSFPYFFMGIIGLVAGLWVGSRVSLPFANLPSPYDRWIPMIVNIVIAVAILDLFLAQARPLAAFFRYLSDNVQRWLARSQEATQSSAQELIIDTSVLIDGRLEAVVETGFVTGKVIIPQFILRELQAIADDADPLRRSRGRRGLDVVAGLQRMSNLTVELSDEWLGSSEAVDARLIRLAAKRRAAIVTVDFNLQRLAQIQGLHVLNVNELATALRPALLPGERLMINIIQKGKERDQGVGYLPDGTMVVVEHGVQAVGETRECEVTRVFQSVAGKMIFVHLVAEKNQEFGGETAGEG
ncbi:hypothetical protein HY523_00790 [Candidatus Berkelbacteria bacterium]|nr:hypothetical protein [Candidatus Berkelbacteria bacterium]